MCFAAAAVVRSYYVLVAAVVGLAVGVGIGLLAAGGGSATVTILNTEKVERAIEQSILAQKNLRANVSCPSGVHQKKGISFFCTASLRTGQAPFRVTEVDDAGNVTYVGTR